MFERLIALSLALSLFTAGAAAGQLPDPTRPTPLGGEVRAAPAEPSWRLTSTLVANGRRVAIIDGQAVGVGDRVHGAKVLQVEREAVLLEHQGRRFKRELQTAPDIKNTSRP